MKKRLPLIGLAVAVLVIAVSVWLWATAGQESTDDAQVDAHVTPVAARVGGTIQRVAVTDNQETNAGATLVELDPRDYQIALDRARAELADAQAAAVAATANVPITSTTAAGNVATAHGGVAEAEAGVSEAEQSVEAARARLTTAQARLREQEANAARAARDVERLKGLLAKDEISQQQFDAAVGAADASRAAADSARSQVREAELAIKVSQSREASSRAGQQRATAELRTAETAPQQVAATRARAESAQARAKQAEAAVKQAELNLEYATVKAPVKGIVSRKSVETGQVVQPGQPLMTIIPMDPIWITANFKETQLASMRPGQPVTVKADAYGGRTFKGHVDSIAAATGSRFSLLPPENATGNFVKVVQRVPVKIVLEQGQDAEHLLRPGMSVTPTVQTKK
jgi:membrane fusion protein (multidrug efflux system)